MSFEAVPCMVKSSEGNDTQYIALVIRPTSSSTAPSTQASTTSVTSRQGVAAAPLCVTSSVLKSGGPISVSGDAPRLLVPANLRGFTPSTSRSNPTPPVAMSSMPLGSTNHWQAQRMNGTLCSATTICSTSPSQQRSVSVCSSSPMAASSPMSPAMGMYSNQISNGCRQDGNIQQRHAQWPQGVSDSSTTPDSGIQSVPGSPPSNHTITPPALEMCTSVREDAPDEEDYADMPRLFPADQEEICTPGPSTTVREDSLSAHGSECETNSAPTLSIAVGMDPAEIAAQLSKLDPELVPSVVKELNKIKKKNMKQQGQMQMQKKRTSSRQESPSTPLKRSRPCSAASEEQKRSDEEIRPRSSSRLQLASDVYDEAEPEPTSSLQNSHNNSPILRYDEVDYKAAARKALQLKMNDFINHSLSSSLGSIKIGSRRSSYPDFEEFYKYNDQNRITSAEVQWRVAKLAALVAKTFEKKAVDGTQKRGRKGSRSERKRREETSTPSKLKDVKEIKLEEDESNDTIPKRLSRTPRKRNAPSDSQTSPDDLPSNDRKSQMEYDDVSRSFCHDATADWRVPPIQCGCTRGACTSDAECVNRALCVQCPKNCQLTLCINKKFWKEDVIRHLIASGPKTKRVLRTRITRRAGDFLGEFAGEVIPFSDAIARWNRYQSEEVTTIPRILALSSKLFIDATRHGNVCRYVRHSCRPNSRLEVWSINGHLRAGLFSLYDISSDAEITINMNYLLPVGRTCTCNISEHSLAKIKDVPAGAKCCQYIKQSRNACLAEGRELSKSEKAQVRDTRVFLLRNRRKTIRNARRTFVPKLTEIPLSSAACMDKVLYGLQQRIRRTDGSLSFIGIPGYSALLKCFKVAVEKWLEKVDDDDYDRVFSALFTRYLTNACNEFNESRNERNRLQKGKFDMDLSYLDSPIAVGSYDPDCDWPSKTANPGADEVRCECGSLEEDGEMLQCDNCLYWLHTDCIGKVEEENYQCKLCTSSNGCFPFADVILAHQPEFRLESCVYYKALANTKSLQVRLYETVYVEKPKSDDHKKILKQLEEVDPRSKRKKLDLEAIRNERKETPHKHRQKLYHRKDLQIFRVERLFVAPGGHRFVFGFYYARPHETVCDAQRKRRFHRQEVFATPMYDTLPLDSVVGRCSVLDPDVWCKGRPKIPHFKEEDVFVCDYQIDQRQRNFERIPSKNRYPLNTQPYVFELFDKPKTLVRDFSPFELADWSRTSRSSAKSGMDSAVIMKEVASNRLLALADKLAASQKPTKKINSNSNSGTNSTKTPTRRRRKHCTN